MRKNPAIQNMEGELAAQLPGIDRLDVGRTYPQLPFGDETLR